MRKCRTLEITWHESAGRENDGPTKHHNARCENARQICPKKFSNCNRKFNNIKCQCREQFMEMLWWIYALITPQQQQKKEWICLIFHRVMFFMRQLNERLQWRQIVHTTASPWTAHGWRQDKTVSKNYILAFLSQRSLSFPNVAFSLTTAFVFLQDWLHWLPGLLPILLSISVFIFIFSTF